MGKFEYESGATKFKGAFNVYQARNGAIMLLMGTRVSALTYSQINDLNINCYELADFNDGAFHKYYLRSHTPDVSNRRELYFDFMKEYNSLMGESEHQILKEEVEVLLAKVSGAKFKIMEGCIKCECGENRFYYFGDYAVCSNCSNEFKETKTNKECVVPNGTAIMPVKELWMRRVNRETGKCSNWKHWSGALSNEP